MTRRDVEIEFTDGEKRTIAGATKWEVRDGVLTIRRVYSGGIGYYSSEDHLGSYPLVNIKSYRWAEEAY